MQNNEAQKIGHTVPNIGSSAGFVGEIRDSEILRRDGVDSGLELENNSRNGAFARSKDVTGREPVLISIQELETEDSGDEGEDVEDGELSATKISPHLVREMPKNAIFSGERLVTPTRQSLNLPSVDLGELRDYSGSGFPLGFTPTKDKDEVVSRVPLEIQREFSASVDTTVVGEVVVLPMPICADTNFLTHRNLRRSPRIKKKPASLDSASSSGLKKGFIK